MKSLTTRLGLPPSGLPGATVRELLQLVLGKFRWFRPERYGFAALDSPVDPEHVDYDRLVAAYEDLKALTVAGRTDKEFLLLVGTKEPDSSYSGALTWVTSASMASKDSWRARHLREVAEIMRLVNAPLGISALDEDIEAKTQRWVRDDVGEVLTFTVRDYSEGLAGLFWRNFFGPPFTRMFGERLSSLPAPSKQDLGDGIILVQPYELPTQAGTPEGVAAERQLISQLGPECFYDHERHLKPTRRPELPHLPPKPG
ncbi:MAG TPA: hypothetical protein VF815_17590 [Myxococcaceae bacterium]